MMMGYSYNSDSASELDKARKFLIDLKPFVHSIDSVNLKQKIIRGKAYGGMAWNGDSAVIIGEKPAEYIIPGEGAEFWIDAYVIPTGAKNPDAAHKWIDFCYQPRVNAQETSFTYYGSPRQADAAEGRAGEERLQQHRRLPPAEPREEARLRERLGEGNAVARADLDRVQERMSQ